MSCRPSRRIRAREGSGSSRRSFSSSPGSSTAKCASASGATRRRMLRRPEARRGGRRSRPTSSRASTTDAGSPRCGHGGSCARPLSSPRQPPVSDGLPPLDAFAPEEPARSSGARPRTWTICRSKRVLQKICPTRRGNSPFPLLVFSSPSCVQKVRRRALRLGEISTMIDIAGVSPNQATGETILKQIRTGLPSGRQERGGRSHIVRYRIHKRSPGKYPGLLLCVRPVAAGSFRRQRRLFIRYPVRPYCGPLS